MGELELHAHYALTVKHAGMKKTEPDARPNIRLGPEIELRVRNVDSKRIFFV